MSKRDDIVVAAISHLGDGPRPEWIGYQWCGLFALACLHEAGVALDINWHIGGGFVLEHPDVFPETHDPQPGDIGIGWGGNWHYRVAVARDGDDIETVEGNRGASPGKVGRGHARASDKTIRWFSTVPAQAYP